MKTQLKNIISGAAVGLALLATTGPTWAGFRSLSSVSIFNSGNTVGATGALQGTRYSSDNSAHIGCVVAEATGYSYVRCTAQDSNGAWMTCKTDDPKYIAVAHAMTSHSYIRFEMPQNTTRCDYLEVRNTSSQLR